MNAYIFIFAFICNTAAFIEPSDNLDCGTVLFSKSTLNKKNWTPAQILVLRARKHFLDLIPPVHILNTRSEDFSNNMLNYFKESLAEVRNEVTDPEIDRALTVALSDTIGGYLKMWVLPVTKFAYYGGTVPTEDALNLFRFHDELKRYLNTDGKGWHNPTPDFLYSMSVNILPLREEIFGSADTPCEDIAYFEKTSTGLAIPVPSVSWEKDFECMFFPIKNQGPVSLNMPDSSEVLMKYYHTARHCILNANLEDIDSFEDRFQKWLDVDVIPHLKDDKLYPAFRSVLSLVNKTRLLDTTATCYSPMRNKTCFPVDLSSKKMMVITIIIILEIAWCIPTLCYLMFTKIKTKKNKIQLYFQTDSKRDKPQRRDAWNYSAYTITNPAQMSSKQVSASPSVQSRACLHEPQERKDVDVETCFPQASLNSIGTDTPSHLQSEMGPKDTVTNDQTNQRGKQLAVCGKTVAVKVSNHPSSDKTFTSKRPYSQPTYDSKTSVNSFTRYKIKKASSSFIKTCCCKKQPSSSAQDTTWCNCNKTSSSLTQWASYVVDKNKDSASSVINTALCNSRKVPSAFVKASVSDLNCECFKCIPEEDLGSTAESFITIQNLQPTQTVTMLQEGLLSLNDSNTSSYIQCPGTLNTAEQKDLSNTKKEEKIINKTITVVNAVASPRDLYKYIPEHDTNISKVEKSKKCVTIMNVSSLDSSDFALKSKRKTPTKQMQSLAIEKASKETMIYVAHKAGTAMQRDLKLEKKYLKTSKPFFEIKTNSNISCNTDDNPNKSSKPSKIPKRFATNTVTQTKSAKITRNSRKSLIPQRRTHLTLEDIVIESAKNRHFSEKNKLNVTL